MKHLLKFAPLFCISLLMLNCAKDDPKPVIEVIQKDTNTVTIVSGDFITKVHQTSGKASILKNDTLAYTLAIENFKTENGPDVRVYLSTTEGIDGAIEVGKLKSNSGSFTYSVANTTDTKKYKYVLIWCKEYSVLFGDALLK